MNDYRKVPPDRCSCSWDFTLKPREESFLLDDIIWKTSHDVLEKYRSFFFSRIFFIVIKHRNYIVPKKIQISVLEETVMNIQLVHLIIRAWGPRIRWTNDAELHIPTQLTVQLVMPLRYTSDSVNHLDKGNIWLTQQQQQKTTHRALSGLINVLRKKRLVAIGKNPTPAPERDNTQTIQLIFKRVVWKKKD